MVDIPEETATIRGDFDQVEQVVINILLNAIEALKGIDGARIEIATHQMEGGRIMLQLRDNGIGIKDSDIDQVFVPFYTTKKQGSGIGLSLARQIMKLHQGDIQLYPAKDAGAIVELYFHSYQYSH
jgi:signal transduction histidine kinase